MARSLSAATVALVRTHVPRPGATPDALSGEPVGDLLADDDGRPSTARVYLARHAEPVDDRRDDDPLLSEKGATQAAALAEALQGRLGSRPNLVVWASDTHRSQRTAEPVAAAYDTAVQVRCDALFEPRDRRTLIAMLMQLDPGAVVVAIGHAPLIRALLSDAGAAGRGSDAYCQINLFELDLMTGALRFDKLIEVAVEPAG